MSDALGVSHWTGRETRLLRQACRMSVRTFAAHPGVATRTVSKWESGLRHCHPMPDNQAVLDTTLERAGESAQNRFALLLGQREPPQTDSTTSRRGTAAHKLGATNTESYLEDETTREEADVRRRELLSVLGATVAGGLLTGVEPLRRGLEATLNLPPTATDLVSWENVASDYAMQIPSLPAFEVLPHLLVDLEDVRSDIDRAAEDLRPPLIRVSALLAAMVAFSFVGIERPREAGRYWRTAQRAGHLFGDQELRGQIAGKRAISSLYEGVEPAAVLRLSEDAVALGDVDGYAARSQALAQWGETRDALRALRELEGRFENLSSSVVDDRRSYWGWSEQRLRWVQSHVYSHTGQVPEATAAQDTALALYPASNWGGPAQVQMHRAMCLVIDGDPTAGARHAVRTFEQLPQQMRSDGLVRRSATQLFDVLPADSRSFPAVREAREFFALPAAKARL